MIDFEIIPLTEADAERVRQFIQDHWGAEIVVAHGQVYYPHTLPGFVAVGDEGEWLGLLTYRIENGACEVVTIDSTLEGFGIGSDLIQAVRQVAKEADCRRLWLITTNDNLKALRFYGKRGFRLVGIHRDAVMESRKIKPSIPLLGNNGIPIRDEIELEIPLDAK